MCTILLQFIAYFCIVKNREKMMIKNIVFDFGGVIADIDRDCAVRAFTGIGLQDADSKLDKYHQTGIFQELEEGKISADEFRLELEKLCKRSLTWKETQHAWLGFMTGVDIRRLQLLEQLRKTGYKLYILSNTNPYVMAWACSEQFTSLQKPLTSYFDKLYLSYQIGCTKPDKAIFEYLITDAQVKPSETLFVDDGIANISTAKNLGFYTFQPRNGTDWRSDFLKILKVFGQDLNNIL